MTLFNEANIFTGDPVVFNMVLNPIKLEFRNVGFWGEGKTGETREKPLGSEKRQILTMSPKLNLATLVGDKCNPP